MDMEVAQMKAVSSIKIKKKSEKQKIAVIILKFEKIWFYHIGVLPNNFRWNDKQCIP